MAHSAVPPERCDPLSDPAPRSAPMVGMAAPHRPPGSRGSFPRLFKPARPPQTAISPAKTIFDLGVTVHASARLDRAGARRAFSAGKVAPLGSKVRMAKNCGSAASNGIPGGESLSVRTCRCSWRKPVPQFWGACNFDRYGRARSQERRHGLQRGLALCPCSFAKRRTKRQLSGSSRMVFSEQAVAVSARPIIRPDAAGASRHIWQDVRPRMPRRASYGSTRRLPK